GPGVARLWDLQRRNGLPVWGGNLAATRRRLLRAIRHVGPPRLLPVRHAWHARILRRAPSAIRGIGQPADLRADVARLGQLRWPPGHTGLERRRVPAARVAPSWGAGVYRAAAGRVRGVGRRHLEPL